MFIEGFKEAIVLLISFNREIYSIIGLSLMISLLATLTASLFGVVLGIRISVSHFKGKKTVKKIIFTFMGIPPVVLGLMVLLLLAGPFAHLNLLFTRTAMYLAQTLLVFPIITGNMIISSEKTQQKIIETATTLGATKRHKLWLLITETKPFVILSMILGFSRAISEVGAVMLVGGNIRGETRVMTTFITLNTSMGNYSASIAMGLILLLLTFVLHSLVSSFRGDFYD